MAKKWWLRIGLLLLIVLWLGFIWHNSAENGTQTVETSDGVTVCVVRLFVSGYDGLGESEKISIIESVAPIVRTFAHAFEFFLLAALSAAFTYTFDMKSKYARQAAIAFSFTVVNAFLDEFHQYFVPGRTADILDVIVDVGGGLVGVGCVVLLVAVIDAVKFKRRKK